MSTSSWQCSPRWSSSRVCRVLCVLLLAAQEVLQGKSYAANIAWLPAADDIQQQQQAASNGYGNSKQQQANSNSVVIDSTALLSAAGSSSSASSSSAPGQLPVSSTRMLAAPPDHQPGASLSLQDFPQQGALCSSNCVVVRGMSVGGS